MLVGGGGAPAVAAGCGRRGRHYVKTSIGHASFVNGP
jgi:hypothetical protein